MLNILYAVLALGIMGLVFGLVLAYASKVFQVKEDERIGKIAQELPGANCGACGFAGCQAMAAAIVEGKAPANGCPITTALQTSTIASIMGVSEGAAVRKRAQVMCSGTKERASDKYEYQGAKDCLAAMRLSGGSRSCSYGCMGLGTCVDICPFKAISLVDGVAVVDPEKCTGCGVCVDSCPKKIISMIPADKKIWVGCLSKDKGPVTRAYCTIGCIGCKLCEKACKFDAITVNDNIATIDYEKCTQCGDCVKACPRNVIFSTLAQEAADGAEKPRSADPSA